MSFEAIWAIGEFSLNLERTKVEVAALNIANANAAAASPEQAFKPLMVVPEQLSSVGLSSSGSAELYKNQQLMLEEQQLAPRQAYEPNHPLAGPDGNVYYSGTSISTEMINMMKAQRAYEATVKVLNNTRSMSAKALDIGRSS